MNLKNFFTNIENQELVDSSQELSFLKLQNKALSLCQSKQCFNCNNALQERHVLS